MVSQMEEFKLEDLGMAYRKAKVDYYYNQVYPASLLWCKYENQLEKNLQNLLAKLNSGNFDWENKDFVGGWSVIPKSIEPHTSTEQDCVYSNPSQKWQATDNNTSDIPAFFRLIAKPSIELQIVTALWTAKIGYRYDAVLGKETYSNRLRRKLPVADEKYGVPNPLSMGTYEPYLHHFREWRDNGLKLMKQALDDDKNVISITADIQQFYHRLSPNFLTDKDYLNQVGLDKAFNEFELTFTDGIVRSINTWALNTPLHHANPKVGLPVGLPISGLIANIALAEFDQMIQKELVPLYYGRYVDDILLVLDNVNEFTRPDDIWNWIFKRTGPDLKRGDEAHSLIFSKKYLGESNITFCGDKQKIFILEGETGKALVKSISRQINKQSSEWRALPDLSSEDDSFTSSFLFACDGNGGTADNLRKIDNWSYRRAEFAIQLRDIEAFERDLPLEIWQTQRRSFFQAVTEHVFSLPNFFDYSQYISRLIGLAIACNDIKQLEIMLDNIVTVSIEIEKRCDVTLIKTDENINNNDAKPMGKNDILRTWRKYLCKLICDTALIALPDSSSKITIDELDRIISCFINRLLKNIPYSPIDVEYAKSLFIHDFARVPFRYIILPSEVHLRKFRESYQWKGLPSTETPLFEQAIYKGVEGVLSQIDKEMIPLQKRPDSVAVGELPLSFLLPTRPCSVAELYILVKQPFTVSGADIIRDALVAFRGYRLKSLPVIEGNNLFVPQHIDCRKIQIAVSSWKTEEKSWNASITHDEDPDKTRYARLNDLINTIMSKHSAIHYLVFPELSIPPRWFIPIATKLHRLGISLICGVEYIHLPDNYLKNEVWASLNCDSFGFPSWLLYRQMKTRPALQEESELHRIGNKSYLEPTDDTKPCIQHGDISFGILICSELTNIKYRTDFRGKVDIIFVAEWNRDTETFNALIESAALDIHAYIVQCNDRQYGDSRIRVPAKETYNRDLVRVKGGINDFYIIGEVNIKALRAFQSAYRSDNSNDALFKPTPDGFTISENRRVLPT